MPPNRLLALLLLAFGALLLGACGERGEGKLELEQARITLPVPGTPMAAGYFDLANTRTTPVTIEGIESPAFESVELHETIDDNGVSRMRRLENVVIEPGQTLSLQPGGKHLMLMGLRGAPIDGQHAVPLVVTLRGADGSTHVVRGEMSTAGDQASDAESHAHHGH